MNDEREKDREEIGEEAPQPAAAEPVKKGAGEVPPELFTAPPAAGQEPWRSGGGCGRLPAYGCAFGVVVLVAALIVGVTLMRRSVWMTFERARQQVVQGLPYDIEPGERLRTTRNLERFRALLENTSDPYPLMGEFVKRVRDAFSDGKLTSDEVEEINQLVEEAIEESGMPGMQLESTNSEFGIRSSEFRKQIPCSSLCFVTAQPPSRRLSAVALPETMLNIFTGRGQARPNSPQYPRLPPRADHSEFRIPNSEFT